MTANLCLKHFPEPIIYVSQNNPMCKKCIPEYLNEMKLKSQGGSSEQSGLQVFQHQNSYMGEQNLINSNFSKMLEFKGDFKYLNEEIKKKLQESEHNSQCLPEQLCQIFDTCEKAMQEQKLLFINEINNVISSQLESFKYDLEVKVPQFWDRLSQKYTQLQNATRDNSSMSQGELIEILTYYHKIFVNLDAEFEKQFNSYENVSKLERLFDKDQDEVLREFNSLVETNLRMDYNVKNSFFPGVQPRVHSFQWNQRQAYIFRPKSGAFQKKQVQMDFDVPLYSRSIATEDGRIYLIGGCIKRKNEYLKKCYRYDEIFSVLEEKAQMIYPHADHSLCAIEGFIYVVGTFVNSQVHGFCEVYDTKKNQWKQIDSLRVPRSGVALSAFKNNYIFAFGGRVDQKTIVDFVECYDISKNVWQEIDIRSSGGSAQYVPGYMSNAYQITDNEIIIFGGKSALTQQVFNGCFVFDVEKLEIKERGKLLNPSSFMNTPLVFNGSLYAFGNDMFIHQY
mmetsp:Transcript_5548/g.9486  ORF Transcript_5548/g.9486 Transcript_5548/m.9486 type:complete len:507 (+) Transcript_5548:963-2483(+)